MNVIPERVVGTKYDIYVFTFFNTCDY